MKHIIPAGTTQPQDFAITDAGAPLDGTGLDVLLIIEKRSGASTVAVDTPPVVAWLDQSGGTVRVSGVETLTAGVYFVRYRLIDADEEFDYAPNGEKADVWHVVPVANW